MKSQLYKGKHTSILVALVCLFNFYLNNGLASDYPVRYNGFFVNYLYSDLAAHYPTRNPEYPLDYRLYQSSPATWGSRFNMSITAGDRKEGIYLLMPLDLRFGTYSDGNSRIYRLYNYMPKGIFAIKDEKILFSIRTSISGNQDGIFRDIDYGFIPCGFLGNFKTPIANDGTLVAKIKATPSLNKLINIYVMQSNATTFIPFKESIPTKVAELRTGTNELGLPVGKLTHVDEGEFSRAKNNLPIYILGVYEGKELIKQGDKWGFYLGRKQVSNPGFRENESDKSIKRVNKYADQEAMLGYSKEALEFNWQGNLSAGLLTFASSTSTANWFLYTKNIEGGPSKEIKFDKIGGNALLIKLKEEKIGDLILNGSYRRVDPDYQWVMARHPEYVLLGSPVDPYDLLSPFTWRMQEDSTWRYRDLAKADLYLSEVSQYLGMNNWNIEVSYL